MNAYKNVYRPTLLNPATGNYDGGYDNNFKIDRLCGETSRQSGIEYGMCEALLLAVLASIFQYLFYVRLPDGRKLSLSGAVIIVAPSGYGKSTLHEKFIGPIREQIKLVQAQFNLLLNSYTVELKLHERSKKKLLKQYDKAVDEDEDTKAIQQKLIELENNKPRKPKMPIKLVSQITTQAIVKTMDSDAESLFIESSEAGGLGGTTLKDPTTLNSASSGELITTETKADGILEVQEPLLTMLLSMQHMYFQKMRTRADNAFRDSGFFARNYIYLVPPEAVRFKVTGQVHSLEQYDEYKKTIAWAFGLITKLWEDESATRKGLTLTPEAMKIYTDYCSELEDLSQPGGVYHHVRDYSSRLADKALMYAGLITAYERQIEISEGAMRKAFIICGNAMSHYIDLFHPEILINNRAKLLVDWMIRSNVLKAPPGCVPNWCYHSQLLQSAPRGLRSKTDLEPVLEHLRSLSIIYECKDPFGSSKRAWGVNHTFAGDFVQS